MLFNSFIFLVFALLFFLLWPFFRNRDGARWTYLSIASCIFYGWWDWRFLFLLFGVGLINYTSGKFMIRYARNKSVLLFISITMSLGALFVFKYSGFVARNLDVLVAYFGGDPFFESSIPKFMLILPIGISFFTFQALSYTIDIHQGRIAPARSFLHFFAYLSLFPQLIAGPIVRASHLLEQLIGKPQTTEDERWQGTKLIVEGFFKKVVIADNLAPFVGGAFEASSMSGSSMYWAVHVVMFSFQIYYDFKGYSDIARGLCKWMGYDIPLNFDHPYIANGLRDFWRRWHISLSTWFRDYVYIPLGGSRISRMTTHRNLWITWFASGVWHGAGWGFIAWGLLHAAYLSIEYETDWTKRFNSLPFGKIATTVITFILVCIAWIFFRAHTIDHAIYILHTILSFKGPFLTEIPKSGLVVLLVALFCEGVSILYSKYSPDVLQNKWASGAEVAIFSVLIVLSVFFRGAGNAFIYFQF